MIKDDKHDLEQHNGINSRIPSFCLLVQSFYFIIYEAPIDRALNFT